MFNVSTQVADSSLGMPEYVCNGFTAALSHLLAVLWLNTPGRHVFDCSISTRLVYVRSHYLQPAIPVLGSSLTNGSLRFLAFNVLTLRVLRLPTSPTLELMNTQLSPILGQRRNTKRSRRSQSSIRPTSSSPREIDDVCFNLYMSGTLIPNPPITVAFGFRKWITTKDAHLPGEASPAHMSRTEPSERHNHHRSVVECPSSYPRSVANHVACCMPEGYLRMTAKVRSGAVHVSNSSCRRSRIHKSKGKRPSMAC